MYEIATDQTTPVNFIAGEFPVIKRVCTIKTSETITKCMPVKLTDGKIEPVVTMDATVVDAANAIPAKAAEENTVEGLYGIAAEDGGDETAVVYLTGEFFADALVLSDGVTTETLTPAFRKLGIFLK